MINDNQVWAKRTFLLLTQLHAEEQEQFESFRGFQLLYELVEPFIQTPD